MPTFHAELADTSVQPEEAGERLDRFLVRRCPELGRRAAASLIERMEKEGIIGAANHAGKREILVPTEDDKF